MRVRFWGTRGSLPSPLRPEEMAQKIHQAILGMPAIDTDDPGAVWAYIQGLSPLLRGTAGGNTPCLEIRAGGEILIIDAGSGIRELGIELMRGPCGQGEGRLHLLISHPHWDHIQGFPMFQPAFVPGNQVFIYGLHDLETALEAQQRPLFWPISLSDMPAEIEFVPLRVSQPISIGKVQVRTIQSSHPGDSYSYRFEDQHCILVHASDAEYKHLDEASIQPYIDFFRDADVLIFDAQYTLREAWQKEDWGHSSAMIGVDLARVAGVKKLVLFHHDPTYSDADLLRIQSTVMDYQVQDTSLPICEVLVAYEGLELDLTPLGAVDRQLSHTFAGETTILTPVHTFDRHGVDQLALHLARSSEQVPSSIIDLSQVETLTTAGLKALTSLRQEHEGASIILAAPSDRIRQVIELGGYQDYFAIYPSVKAALAAIQARETLDLPGQMIQSRYLIESKLGEGPLGTVLKANDTRTYIPVALKIFSPVFSQETLDRLLQQARRITALDHRNIVKVFGWDQAGGHTYKVEECMIGETLQDFLGKGEPPLSGDQALGIALDIARALEYAHSRGVIHGDLKPSNIFLAPDGAKVSDFGLGSLAQGYNLLEAPVLFLTAAYLAPEQILGQPVDARTDLYALGVILYQLFTGKLPFSGSNRQVLQAHLQTVPVPPRGLNPHLSLSLEHLILKLLAKNPNDRYASAQQIRRISGSLMIGPEDVPGRGVTPLVGREEELHALQDHWEETLAGRGQLVFITGESGIGKTSLARRAVARSGAPVQLIGRCQERRETPAYHLFIDILRAYFATVPPEFFDPEVSPLLGDFSRLVPELRQILPDLPAPPPLEPEQEQLRLMISLTQFIKHATRERPWLMLLDDLQWADPSSLELLHYLGHHLPSMALMMIGTYRDVEVGPDHPLREMLHGLSRHPTYRQFSLGRLDQAEVGLVLANIWQQAVPPALTQRIYQHTGGNPFYVGEVARGLVDDGLISMHQGLWQFPSLDDVRLPPSVHEAVLRRIDHLSQDTQALLRRAAVLGPIFGFEELQEMSGLSQWQVLEHLDMALERQLVQELPGDTILGFRHVEVQQVLYADLSPLRRRVLHRQAGEILERRAMPEPEGIAEKLAYHFTEAGELDRAVLYGMEAARQAQAAYANEAALMWYNRALEMLDRFEPEAAFQVQSLRLSAHQSLGEVLALLGRNDEALEHYATAWALSGLETPSPDQSRRLAGLCCLMAKVYETRSEYDLALEWLDKGLSFLDENEATIELTRIYNVIGLVRVRQGDYSAALAQHERALTLARIAGVREVEAHTLLSLGAPTWYLGDFAQARAYLEQGLAIYRQIGDLRGQGGTLNNLGVVANSQGDYAASKAYYEQALPLYQEVGDRWSEGMLSNNLGIIAKIEGDYAAARAYYDESLHIFAEIGDRWGEALLLNNLGVLSLSLGNYAQAQAYLEQALVVKREIGDRGDESETLAYLGLLSHHMGDDETARRHGQQGQALAAELGDRPNESYALTFLGHALAGAGKLAEAAAAFRRAMDLRRELGQPHMAMEPLAGLALVSLTQGNLPQAQAQIEEILDFLETRRSEGSALAGTEEPFRIYLACYRVLQAGQDPRARDILQTAHRLLQEHARSIAREDLQRMFLENVTAHREIVIERGEESSSVGSPEQQTNN